MCELAIRYCSRPEPQLFAIRILGSESNPWAEKLESIQSNLQVARFQTPLHGFILDCGSLCAMGQVLLIDCSIASSVRSSFFNLPNGIGSSVFVPLEQFHDSSHVQLAQTLADGFAKDISDRSDGGRVHLSPRGMNRIAKILFEEFDCKLRSESPAQHGGRDMSGDRTPDRGGRNRIKDLLGIDTLP